MAYSINKINELKPKGSRLTAIEFCDNVIYKAMSYRAVLAHCECGGKIKIITGNMVSGRTKSCGCWATESRKSTIYTHSTSGKYNGIYSSYKRMMDRCGNKKNKQYRFYGGRGVRVCKEWKNNYQSFLNWALLNGWSKGLQLDKDKLGTGKIYSPLSCCWLTQIENSKYKSKGSALIIEYYDKMITLGEISKLSGINRGLLYGRIYKNKRTIYEAIEMGIHPIKKIKY